MESWSVTEGTSKVGDHIVAVIAWIIWCLSARKHPTQLARLTHVAVLWNTMTEPVPAAACDSDTNICDLSFLL